MRHEAFGTPDFYFTALMIAHSFPKVAVEKKAAVVPWGLCSSSWQAGPSSGQVVGPFLPVPYPAAQVGDDGCQVDVLPLVALQLVLALGQFGLCDLEDVRQLLQVSQL